jgi:chemotaxis signal transduction protein
VEPTAEQEPAPPPKPVFQWKAVPADPPALPPEPPKPTPPLIDFAAALQALKAARPAAPKAPEPPPAPVELSPPIEEAVVVAAVEAVQAVEPAPQPEPTAVVAEPEPEPEPEPVALQPESEPEAVVVAEPEPEPAPQPEWEEIAAPLPPPGKPAGPELASVVAGLEASLPAANLDFAAAGSQRVELRRHLVFAINSEKFAVNLDNLLEIDNMPTWTGIPGLPQSVRGLINLRGEIVSLLELRAILGLPHPDVPKKGKIFVAATADRQAVSAFAVDEIEGIFGFDEARINPLPSLTSGSSITATVEDEGRLVRIVDIGAVLADVEKTFSLDQVWL